MEMIHRDEVSRRLRSGLTNELLKNEPTFKTNTFV